MKIDLDIAYEYFTLDPSLPGGIRWSKHRGNNSFSCKARFTQYYSTFAGNPAGSIKLYNKSKYWVTIGTPNHRIVWMLHNNEYIPDGMIIDHIDINTENNNPLNLRLCTAKESSRNRLVQSNNLTGLKGVVYDPSKSSRNKYIAKIMIDNKKSKYIGVFLTPEEAHDAYVKAAKVYHGEFANV
jgi:hypothetical protein